MLLRYWYCPSETEDQNQDSYGQKSEICQKSLDNLKIYKIEPPVQIHLLLYLVPEYTVGMHWDTFVDAFVPAWLGAFLSAWGWSVDVRYCSSGRREGLVKTSQIYKNTTIKNQSRQFRNIRQNTWKNLWRNQFNQYIFFFALPIKSTSL